MSREIHIDSIKLEVREQIIKELQIKVDGSTFIYNSKPSYIYPIDEVGDYAYIPFAYGRKCVGGPFPCPDRKSYSTLNCEFSGGLRDHQNEVKKETESEFLEVFSSVLDLRRQIDLFQGSLQTKYTDWIAFARLIDSYRNIGLLKTKALTNLASKDAKLKEKYGKL